MFCIDIAGFIESDYQCIFVKIVKLLFLAILIKMGY